VGEWGWRARRLRRRDKSRVESSATTTHLYILFSHPCAVHNPGCRDARKELTSYICSSQSWRAWSLGASSILSPPTFANRCHAGERSDSRWISVWVWSRSRVCRFRVEAPKWTENQLNVTILLVVPILSPLTPVHGPTRLITPLHSYLIPQHHARQCRRRAQRIERRWTNQTTTDDRLRGTKDWSDSCSGAIT
jgi:hypothetical protein